MINFRDGGGRYPVGSDTPDAPWNQPDLEVTDEHYETAESEVWFLLNWNENENPDICLPDVLEMIQNVCPSKYFDLDFELLLVSMEITDQDHEIAAALNMMPEERRKQIKVYAEAWVDDRAADLAREGF